MEVEIVKIGSNKTLTTLRDLSPTATIQDVKKRIYKTSTKLYPERQALRVDPKGKSLPDETTLETLSLKDEKVLFLKDLGPQIGWKTVFLWEYTGPLVLYLVTYLRPALLYGVEAASVPKHTVVHLAAMCWSIHYCKRIIETLFVHRFSHGTMPIKNLFKNCSYYWLFGLYIGYYINHPLYMPPMFGDLQMYLGLAGFIKNELGNLSIHLALKNLRPPGTKVRKVPVPTSNPFTHLFNFVSCPNYTYEVMSWVCFTIMTQCLPGM
ncbi:very-long-chain enoyl-CoA reductase-like [Limulus polyphemus]|uniref:very-long-chain enoyl-CoA reductase n=1 Tax=Limulus polyphemus TaxID=6850 RepID=A0ABM1BKK7_LIMPO|nr:very-long-chain enoyl-CoA reductase-like [Limulus polyphemus]